MTAAPDRDPDSAADPHLDPQLARAAELVRAFPPEPEKPDARAECERLLPDALAAADACLAADAGHEDAAHLLSLAGRFELARGRAAEARRLLERAVDARERAHGAGDERLAMDLTWLNGALAAEDDRAAMAANARRATSIFEAARGPRDPVVITHVNNLGVLLHRAGELDEARATLERAHRLTAEEFGRRHPFHATVSVNLADALLDAGEAEGARRLLEEALEIDEAVYGREHASVARDLFRLGRLLARIGETTAARGLLGRALAFHEARAVPDDPRVHALRDALARLG